MCGHFIWKFYDLDKPVIQVFDIIKFSITLETTILYTNELLNDTSAIFKDSTQRIQRLFKTKFRLLAEDNNLSLVHFSSTYKVKNNVGNILAKIKRSDFATVIILVNFGTFEKVWLKILKQIFSGIIAE